MSLKTIRIFTDDLVAFLKHPGRETTMAATSLSRCSRFWLALLVSFCITVGISAPLIHLVDRFLVRLRFSSSMDVTQDFFLLIVLGVMVAPLLEELVFRYPLKLVKPRYLKLAVYFSSIVFGLVHAINYENSEPLFYALLPIIVSSQALGGLILAYLRLRDGVLWSMFAHGLFNAAIALLSLLFLQNRMALDEKEDHYHLTVKEYAFKNGKQKTHIHRNGRRIDSIMWRQGSLQSLVDSLHGNGLYADKLLVDVDLKTSRPLSADSVLALLKKQYRIE